VLLVFILILALILIPNTYTMLLSLPPTPTPDTLAIDTPHEVTTVGGLHMAINTWFDLAIR
jgi:hypothetical protein